SGNGFALPVPGGAFAPVVQYPPLYPFLLALFEFLPVDTFLIARALNAVLFAASVFLTGWIAATGTGIPGAAVAAGVLMVTALPMVQAHSMAWSEPLFIALVAFGVFCLLNFSRNGSRLWLMLA